MEPAPGAQANGEVVAPLVAFALFTGFLIVAAPVALAIADPISGLIYCFALFQAWQMNKRVRLAVNGPFQVKQLLSNGPPAGEPHDGE